MRPHGCAARRERADAGAGTLGVLDVVAKLLGIARDTVYRWIDMTSLPPESIGRLWKFNLSDIDERVRVFGAIEDESESGGQA